MIKGMKKRKNLNTTHFILCLILLFFIIISCTACGNSCEHIESQWIIDKEATIDAAGSKHIECTVCGKILKTEAIPQIVLTKKDIVNMISPCLFKVYSYDYDGKTLLSQGTGFFIDDMGNFITNAHVIDDTYYVKIKLKSGLTYEVDKIYEFSYLLSDYAICHAKTVIKTSPVSFSEDLYVGQTVYALGYPHDSFILQTSVGELVSTDTYDKGIHYLENTAKIDPGSSGGVLSNSKGEIIGIYIHCQAGFKFHR